MKITITILFLLFISAGIFSQEIEPGEYMSVIDYDPVTKKTTLFGMYREVISIGDSGNFTYMFEAENDKSIGFGEYKATKYFLNLEFMDFPDNGLYRAYTVIDSIYTESDSIIVNIHVHEDGIPLSSARVIYEKDSAIIEKKGTNKNGDVRLRFLKKETPGVISVTYVGYEELLIPIQNSFDKRILVNLDSQYDIIEKGKKMSYRIKDVDLDGFYLKGEMWGNWTLFLRTKKEY
ncbi:MAG: hypothetical protein K8I03_04025 [Ignavibacteria bacterium]|nr:hypothetical protein [Ignavibacteria bacterium]